jgi:hypothetical protein
VLARPLVVLARHLVEHARADAAIEVARLQEEIDDRGEGEAGAGALVALVQDLGYRVDVDQDVGQRRERRLIEPVADVDAIGHRVERPADAFGGGDGPLRRPSRRRLGARGLG